MVPIRTRAVAVLATAVAAALAGTGAAAQAETPDDCYAVAAQTLTGPPQEAQLTLRVSAAAGCAAATELKKVQIKIYDAAGEVADVRNLTDERLNDGMHMFGLGVVPRGRRVDADVLIQTEQPKRTWVVRSETTALLRPAVTVVAVDAPPQTLSVR